MQRPVVYDARIMKIKIYLVVLVALLIAVGACTKLIKSADGKLQLPTYGVIYNLNGAEGAPPEDQLQYAIGERVIALGLPADISPPSSEMEFAGWATRANGKGRRVKPGKKITMQGGGLTLYARWIVVKNGNEKIPQGQENIKFEDNPDQP